MQAEATAALELRGIHKNFGPTAIIRGVDLSVGRGQLHALIGPNGAGKSTLFHLISGRMPATAGEIRVNGQLINGLSPFAINRLGVSRSFQVTNIFPRLSVFENVRCSVLWSLGYRYAFWHGVAQLRDVNDKCEEVLRRINLWGRRDTPAGVLAYAEQRALEIGVAIAPDPQIIMLDEPSAGMSHSETEQAMHLIREVSQGKTLLMVEHDMNVVFGLAEHISVLVYGQVIASDTPERIRGNPAVREAYLGQAQPEF